MRLSQFCKNELQSQYSFTYQASTACSDLAAMGKRAVLGILKVLYKFKNQSMKLFGKHFYSKVQPVLLYAGEIWGPEDGYCYQTEGGKSICLH